MKLRIIAIAAAVAAGVSTASARLITISGQATLAEEISSGPNNLRLPSADPGSTVYWDLSVDVDNLREPYSGFYVINAELTLTVGDFMITTKGSFDADSYSDGFYSAFVDYAAFDHPAHRMRSGELLDDSGPIDTSTDSSFSIGSGAPQFALYEENPHRGINEHFLSFATGDFSKIDFVEIALPYYRGPDSLQLNTGIVPVGRVSISTVPVPEPSTYGVAGGLLLIGAIAIRRHLRRKV